MIFTAQQNVFCNREPYFLMLHQQSTSIKMKLIFIGLRKNALIIFSLVSVQLATATGECGKVKIAPQFTWVSKLF